jgi:23S rRNA pseudouridine2604 synthase
MAALDTMLMRALQLNRVEAHGMIEGRFIQVNGVTVTNPKLSVLKTDTVKVTGVSNGLVQNGQSLSYQVYNKPHGVECTLNAAIPNSLCRRVEGLDLYPVGRLDKESEGLVLMTNDGRLYKAITTRDTIEKEYEVTVNRNISDAELSQLASGIEIMGSVTLPAIVERLDNNKFRIILKEGRNRQIRRMCYKLNLNVTRLIRVRIHDLLLGDLKSGEFRNATDVEVAQLRSLYSDRFIAS